MGWQPRLHFDQKRRSFYCTFRKRKWRLGSNRAAALREFRRITAGSQTAGEPAYVAEGVERWLGEHPSDWHEFIVLPWAAYAGRVRIADLGPDALADYARHLQRQKKKPAPRTVCAKVGYAARICRWFVERGWLDRAPATPKLPRPVGLPRDVEPTRLARTFLTLPASAERILRFVLETGCRPSEACGLTWEQVDRDRSCAVLSGHKTAATGKPRSIFLSASAVKLMEAAGTTSGPVFLSRRRKPYHPSGLRSILRRRGITPYQLRHTFAQHALSQIPMEDVAALLGHSDLRTVQTYAQIRDDRLRRVASALTSPLPPPPATHPDAAPPAALRAAPPPRRGRRASAQA